MVSSAYAWVRPELEVLFEDLAQALEQLAASTADGARAEGRTIDRLVHLLEQLRGTLVMLELVSVLRVIDELSATLREVARGQASGDAVEGLVEVGLQLPDVVDALAASDRDGTGALLGWPLINRLREARGLPAIEQAPLGVERWAQIAPGGAVGDAPDAVSGVGTLGDASDAVAAATASGGSGARDAVGDGRSDASALLRRCRRARQRFQRALLVLMRQGGDADAFADLVAVCDELVRAMPHVDLRRLAWVTRALLESLETHPERWTSEVKRLLGRVDRQLGWFLRRFEDRLREAPIDLADFPQAIYAVPAELVDQLLQLVSQPEYDAASTRALRAGLVDAGDDAEEVPWPTARAGRSVIEHLQQAVEEAWVEQRTRLETLLSLPTRAPNEFAAVANGLGRLADTLTIAGDEASAERARTLAQAVAALEDDATLVASEGAYATDARGLAIAEASIELEHAIQRFFARSAAAPTGSSTEGGALGASLSESVFAEVVREISEVKAAALTLFSAAENGVPDAATREPVLVGLDRVQGALAMAAVESLADYVGRLREAVAAFPVRESEVAGGSRPGIAAIEALAEAVAVAEVAAESLLRPLFDLDALIERGDRLIRRFHRLLADAAGGDASGSVVDRPEARSPVGADTADGAGDEGGASDARPAVTPTLDDAPTPRHAEGDAPRVPAPLDLGAPDPGPSDPGPLDLGLLDPSPIERGIGEGPRADAPADAGDTPEPDSRPSSMPTSAALAGATPGPRDAESAGTDAPRPVAVLAAAAFDFDRDVLDGAPLVEDADPELQAEIVDVFVEEAEEACARINELWPLWCVNRAHTGYLSEIRRAFHTLKGSGRMAGALRLGEFAWSVEAFLNWLLRQNVEADEAMVAALDDAREAMPRLIDEVRGQSQARLPVLDIALRLRWLTVPRDDDEPDDEPPIDADRVAADEPSRPVALFGGLGDPRAPTGGADAPGATVAGGGDIGAGGAPVEPRAVEGGADAAAGGVVETAAGEECDGAPWTPELDATLWSIFVDEARQHLDTVDDLLQRVSQAATSVGGGDAPVSESSPLDQVFVETLDERCLRAVHTLHGASRALDLPMLSCVMAPLERLLTAVLDAQRAALGDRPSDTVAAGERPTLDRQAPSGLHAAVADAVEVARWVVALRFDDARQIHARRDLSGEGPWPGGIDGRLTLDVAATLERLLQAVTSAGRSAPLAAADAAAADAPAAASVSEAVADGSGGDRERVGEAPPAEGGRTDDEAGDAAAGLVDEATARATGPSDAGVGEGLEPPAIDALRSRHEVRPAADGESGSEGASIDVEFAEVFLEEAVDLLEACDRALRAWRETGALIAADAQSAFLRDVHTLKGSARMAGFVRIGALAHGIETAVAEEQHQFGATRPELFRLLDQALAEIERWVRLGAVPEQTRIDPEAGILTVLRAWPNGPAAARWLSADSGAATHGDSLGGARRFVEDGARDAAEQDASDGVSGRDGRSDGGAQADRDPSRLPVDDTASATRGTAAVTASGATTTEAARTRPEEPQEQVRVPARLLDTMVNEAGEILTFQRRVDQGVARLGAQLDEFDRTVARLRQQLRSLEIETEAQILFRVDQATQAGEEFDPLEMDRYSGLQQLARALAESVNDLDNLRGEIGDAVQGASALLEQQARVVEDLQSHLASQRLVSFSRSVPRLRRVAEQAAAETRRLVDVRFEGAQVQLDRAVLDRLIGPLEHLLRNALVHGIERPDERERLGKPRVGSLRISLRQVAGELHLDVFDDGRGIDPERVRARAVEAGLLAADAELRDEDVIPLILQPGFSTASEVTELAGRGVGLDVVNSEIKQLGGRLQIASKVGRGTQFQLRVPLSLTVTKALIVSRGEHTIAVPVSGIEGVVRIQASDLDSDGQTRWFDALDRTWQLFDLAGLLDPEHSSGAMFPVPDHAFPVLLVRDDGPIAAAVFVDAIRPSQEIVVKSVGAVLSRLPAIAGATLSADGEVHVIMDLPSLLRFQTQMRSVPVLPEEHRPHTPRVLVVDDSVTIRKVTSRVLERAGYEVHTARDGLEAVGLLDELAPDVILLDVEMPRMDGFEFATHVRDHERFADLPIIMITSRTGTKHRERARTIGVNAYLGKPFLEHELLAEIRQWLARTTPASSQETVA